MVALSSIGHSHSPRKIVLIVLTRSEFVDTDRKKMHGEFFALSEFFVQPVTRGKKSLGWRSDS